MIGRESRGGRRGDAPGAGPLRPRRVGISYIRPGPSGFTLLEVIIVFVIISLAVLLVAPRFFSTMGHMEVRGAAKKISAILRFCRSNAVNKNKIFQVSFDAESNLVSVQSADEQEGKMTVQNSYPVPKDVRMEKLETGKTLIESPHPAFEFYPNGGANGGTAVLRAGEGPAYAIEVDFLTGVVKVETAREK